MKNKVTTASGKRAKQNWKIEKGVNLELMGKMLQVLRVERDLTMLSVEMNCMLSRSTIERSESAEDLSLENAFILFEYYMQEKDSPADKEIIQAIISMLSIPDNLINWDKFDYLSECKCRTGITSVFELCKEIIEERRKLTGINKQARKKNKDGDKKKGKGRKRK